MSLANAPWLSERERGLLDLLRPQLRDPALEEKALSEINRALIIYESEHAIPKDDLRRWPTDVDRDLDGLAEALEGVAARLEGLTDKAREALTIKRRWLHQERKRPRALATAEELLAVKFRAQSLAARTRCALADLRDTRKIKGPGDHWPERNLARRLADVWERYTVGNWARDRADGGPWLEFAAFAFEVAGSDLPGTTFARAEAAARRVEQKSR